ncbi:hypothetical protein GCM10027047_06680 [Rhodococcus aerolatus]
MTRVGPALAVLPALLLGALAGCSQVAALAPVGGDRLAEVRFATNDVLVERAVALLTAPVCTADGEAVTCTGSTVDQQPVTATSSAADPGTLVVTVGPTTVFSGSLQDVLTAAARPSS